MLEGIKTLTTYFGSFIFLLINWVFFLYLQEDKGFDKSLFERQMSVLRGQVNASVILFSFVVTQDFQQRTL